MSANNGVSLSTPTDVEIFAGAGGLAVGLQKAGFFPADFYEMDEDACDTLRFNIARKTPTLTGAVYRSKAEEIEWRKLAGKVRLLAGGVPCQPFSLAGKHLAERDGRNLFPEMMRAVRELRPMAVFLENVRGLARESLRPYLEYILRQLECPSINPRHEEVWQSHDARIRKYQFSVGYEPEYQVTPRLFDAADFGVPQQRQRLIIVATRHDFPGFKFPRPTHSKAALLAEQKNGDYWERHGMRPPKNFTTPVLDLKNAMTRAWLTVRDGLSGLPEPSTSQDGAWMNHWRIEGARSYPGHSGSRLDWPAKTNKIGVRGMAEPFRLEEGWSQN